MSKEEGKKIGIEFTEALAGDVSGFTPVPVGYSASTIDLAQGKLVTAGNATYGAATSAVDGNVSTYWGTYSTLPWWIVVNLAEVKKTAGFSLLQNNSSYRARAYNIQGSNDNLIWATIQSGELANIADQIIEYPVSDYQYIKLNFTSYWSSSRAYIYTLKILEAKGIGNEVAFTITGQEYKYVNGPLVNGNYKVEKIESHPTRENSLLLTMKSFMDFNKVEGLLTINYDATKGNLSGQGGTIDSFETSFSPVELVQVPNPGIIETITGAPTISINYLEVTYHKGYTKETITAAPAEITVAFLSIEEINP